MKEIYLLSGLGADKRVFGFLDLAGFKINHIHWVPPLDNETIERYANRLTKQITTSNPILIGVSFGGMIAIEIGKLIPTEKIILISSARTKLDIPLIYRFIGRFKLNLLIPRILLKTVNVITYWIFGTTTKNEKELLKTIIDETDEVFARWAINQIVNWRNESQLDNAVLIHGTNDRILPHRNSDFAISNGGHLMIIAEASKISDLIKQIIF